MAFQNSLFWLVDKRSVKTHIQTVVRIFRIWTGVPDVKCSQTQFSHIIKINRLLTLLLRSVLWNIRPLFFAWTLLLRRSVHTKKPRSDISQYRPHARSISCYNITSLTDVAGTLGNTGWHIYLASFSIFTLIAQADHFPHDQSHCLQCSYRYGKVKFKKIQGLKSWKKALEISKNWR
jgi:hypothetical protein